MAVTILVIICYTQFMQDDPQIRIMAVTILVIICFRVRMIRILFKAHIYWLPPTAMLFLY